VDDKRDPSSDRLRRAAEVVRLEARTLEALEQRLDASFSVAVDLILGCEGMVVVTGMGKAGLVGAKISATLASTGTPSLCLHPAEALHGDLGRVRRKDVLLALSNSGETNEIQLLVPAAKRLGAAVIAITGHLDSSLGRLADCVLELGPAPEACPLGLAPTTSTTAMLALGDALAMVIQAERGFGKEDYALYHPAGALGRRLMQVGEVMRRGAELPLVPSGTSLRDVVKTMGETAGRPGAALVVDTDGLLAGIFTDGDLRRMFQEGREGELDQAVDAHMARDPVTASPESLLEEAVRVLRDRRVDQLPVLDADGRPVGLLDVQDVLDIRV
jgi:arabinose-5-phosphate isomerase